MAKRYEDINGRTNPDPKGGTKSKPRLPSHQNGSNVSWGLANPEMLAWCITSCTVVGVGLIFGTTRDGGALSVTVLQGNESEKYYVTPSDDVNLILKEIGEYYGQ